ncbi:MAG: phosphodiester glycosidase family protein [Sulfitobacter sp.]
MTRLIALLCAVIWGQSALAASCEDVSYRGASYTVCTVDLTRDSLRLFLYDDEGTPYGGFGAVDKALGAQGARLGFAMNAGMYHENRAPVGLYTEAGKTAQSVITSAGPGNFGLLPNGVLCLRPGRADVFETLRFTKAAPDCRDATQSGPMLVIDGALHPRFLKDGSSKYIRNGVGTSADGKTASFAISNQAVNFYEFGLLFRDHIGVPNALYFDGNISRLRAPDLNRQDLGFTLLGPIIGVVTPAP